VECQTNIHAADTLLGGYPDQSLCGYLRSASWALLLFMAIQRQAYCPW